MWWKKKEPAAPPAPAPAADPQQAFQAAYQHHQAGRLQQAAALYTQVLDSVPDHFHARHLLGVIALQEGRLDEARDHITQALRSNPRDGAAFSNLGTVHLRAGRLAEARASYESATQLDPNDANAVSNLGTVLMRLGDPVAAATRLRAALAAGADPGLRNDLGAALLAAGDADAAAAEFRTVLYAKPNEPAAHNNYGLALEQSGDAPAALQEFERALQLDPAFADAANNRASLLVRLGRLEEAREGFEAAVRHDPLSAGAHANLGAFLRESGELEAARVALGRALELDPRLFEARYNLVSVALELGEVDAAHDLLDRLLKDDPRSAEAHALRGQLLLSQGRLLEADAALAQALELQPGLAQAHHWRGLVRMARGDAEGARASHEEALRADPSLAEARWASVMARLPASRETADAAALSREAFAAGLRELDAWFQGPRAAQGRAAIGSTQPFYVAYQPGNHRDLLRPYGALCERLARDPVTSAAPTPRAAGSAPIRVGIVSAHIRDHSVWTAIVRGWAAHFDRGRFELAVFSVGRTRDAQTEVARGLFSTFEGGAAGMQEWARRISQWSPDVLLYPEIGMDAMTTRLASQRLAPLQLAGWGHPLTTGLPTIDAFISAAALEPPNASDHYTEELVALPGLGVCYEPLGVTPERIDRARLGLPPDAALLLCPGLPQKYAPEDDGLWVDIARQVPAARLVFFQGGAIELADRLSQRLRTRFEAAGLRYQDHVCWLPFLTRPQFFGLMREATLFLDSVGFSGFNTAMQAVECGLPIVALEGDSMRARFGSGILREIGLDECVARSNEEYAGIVASLVTDDAQRAAIAAHLRKYRDRVFGTQAPVEALAAFIESRVRG